MIIKDIDGRDDDLSALDALLLHPQANNATRAKIEREKKMIAAGVKGEREVAYELNSHFSVSKNIAVIHDLRIEHNGQVAQIDHLFINRMLECFVLETKRLSEGIAINEHGECSMFWNGRPVGIASPFEQNRKHIEVLKRVFKDEVVSFPKRLGLVRIPVFRGLVVVSKNARISRPKTPGWWSTDIVKADQLNTFYRNDIENTGVLDTLREVGRVAGADTLLKVAQDLAALHVPIKFDWHARFGLSKESIAESKEDSAPQEDLAHQKADDQPMKAQSSPKTATCVACNAELEPKVARFCRLNKRRFEGRLYCMQCQSLVAKVKRL